MGDGEDDGPSARAMGVLGGSQVNDGHEADASPTGSMGVLGGSQLNAGGRLRVRRALRLGSGGMPMGRQLMNREVTGVLGGTMPGLGEFFPGALGLRHVMPNPNAVDTFYENMLACSADDLKRKWFKHYNPLLMCMNGEGFVYEYGPDGELSKYGFKPIWRMLVEKENRVYGRRLDRFRGILPLALVEELMKDYADMDHEVVRHWLTTTELGYNLQALKKIMLVVYYQESFSLYVADIEKRHVWILDPSETSEELLDMQLKHHDLAKRVVKNLRKSIHQHIPGWRIPGHVWHLIYNHMHPSCTRELSGYYVVHYIREFNGDTLSSSLTEEHLEFLRRSIAYEVLTMRGNKGHLPSFMFEDIAD